MNIKRVVYNLAKTLLILTLVLAVISGAALYFLPGFIQSKLVDLIQEATGRKTSIAKVDFSVMPLQLNLHDFAMLELNGQPFASFNHFDIKINTKKSIAQSELVIDQLILDQPIVHIARTKNGDFNFKDLIKKETKKKEEASTPLPPFTINKLIIAKGKLTWKDAKPSQPEQEIVTPINVNVENLTSKADIPANVDFSLALGSGGQFNWKANAGINPIKSAGHIKLDKIKLQHLKTLALQDLEFDLKGDELIELDYVVAKTDKATTVAIKKSNIEFHDVQVAKDNILQLNVPKLALTGEYDLSIDKALKLTVKQSKLALQDSQFSQAANNMLVKIPAITLESDINVSQSDQQLAVNVNSSKLSLQNALFTTDQPGRIQVKAPSIILESQCDVSRQADKLDIITKNGKLTLQDLQLSEQGKDLALVKVPEFSVQGAGVNVNKQQVTVDLVSASNAEVKAWLDAAGINFQTLFAGQKSESPVKTASLVSTEKAPAQASTNPWNIQVNNIKVANFGLSFEDRTLKKPTTMTAKPINASLSNYNNQTGTKLPFDLSVDVNQTGAVKLKGNTVLSPLSASVAVDVKKLDLEKFQPYVDRYLRLDIIDGDFQVDGNVTVATVKQDQLDIKFKGNTGVSNFLTRDQIKNKDFVKWQDLTLKDVNADVLANKYSAAALVINKPYARVIIKKDKSVNFQDILPAPNTKTATPVKVAAAPVKPNPGSTSSKINFKLDKIQIIDGASDFADLSLILPFAAKIKSLDGGASGINSDKNSIIKADLKGNAYDLAPVDISGEISPFQNTYDITVNFDGMPMPLISSYMVQFAGYKIEKGKITLGLNYKIANGQLTASNKIMIDQLELGEKVENPNAVSLPLELAIALMKDSEGKIKIDVPISGSMEDPQFSISHIIVDALINVITKIVTSPFTAISSLMGSQEDLSSVTFAAGSKELSKTEMTKLDTLAKALKEKQQLNIDIKGTAFQDLDWPQLSDDALYDQIRQILASELNKEAARKTRAENVYLSEGDYNRILAKLFIEKFPTMAERTIFGKPKLINPEAGDFYAVAKQKMSDVIQPELQRLKDLANERAKAIAQYLVQKGGVANERVYILDTAIDPKREKQEIASVLTLKTK